VPRAVTEYLQAILLCLAAVLIVQQLVGQNMEELLLAFAFMLMPFFVAQYLHFNIPLHSSSADHLHKF